MRKSGSGWTMAFLATLALSTTAPLARVAISSSINPTTLLVLRFWGAALLLGLTARAISGGGWRIGRRGMWACVLAGVANGVGTLAFFWSLRSLSASMASMLISLYPAWVFFFLWLRGGRFTALDLGRLGLGFGGVYLLLKPAGQASLWAGLLAVLAGIGYALHLAIVQWYLRDESAPMVTFYTVLATAITLSAAWLFQAVRWVDPGWQGWLAVGALALIGTYLARLATYIAVRRIGSDQVSLLAPLETLLTVIWSVIFLHEHLSWWQGLGGAAILASAVLFTQSLRAHPWPAAGD
jgi:drug/metabolite transporter (DMT)-like permease